MPKRSQLVCQQLENISGTAIERYKDIIREYTRGRNGVYALYKGKQLYYVGLAKSLQGRLKSHLRDRHRNAWDRFSVYLTVGDAHLKEMESLLLRIAKPVGNKVLGRFFRCDNLQRRFTADVRLLLNEELNDVVGRSLPERKAIKQKKGRDVAVLAIYKNRPRRLRGKSKGTTFKASVRNDGRIRFNRKSFASPSHAAAEAVGHSMNGWWFWQYERAPGDWVRLRELRK